jgi:YegS/Rv2252/BmrU family lipid kinase
MSEKICIILNPAAKGERARHLIERLRKLLPKAKIESTRFSGEAQLLTRIAVQDGFEKIVAAGGDGTLNDVVNGIPMDSSVKLGFIPLGTMNVFAHEMGIPFQLDRAVKVVAGNKTKWIDTAFVNEKRFVQLAGVGLDALIVEKTDFNSKKLLGPLSYLITMAELIGQPAPKLKIRAGRKKWEGSFVLIGNGRFYGGPFQLFPKGKINDGALDVCVFKKMSPLDILRYMEGILTGSHTHFSDVEYFQAKSLDISAVNPSNIPIEVDGEYCGTLPAHFSIQEKALQVLVP